MCTVELRDLYKFTTELEITTAVNTALDISVEAKVFVSKPNSLGQRLDVISLR